MSSLIWWVGAIHVTAYLVLGSLRVGTWLFWKAHTYGQYNARIMQWHLARARWQERHTSGLTEQEWRRGEPKP